MQIEDLYINAKNIVTLLPFISMESGVCGLQINGNNIVCNRFDAANEEEANAKLTEVKELAKKIIAEVEGTN